VDFVIAPQQIELPNPEPGTIRDIACGRAHTVIVTDQAGQSYRIRSVMQNTEYYNDA